eukprot:2451686-Prymnesium_polylepis.1
MPCDAAIRHGSDASASDVQLWLCCANAADAPRGDATTPGGALVLEPALRWCARADRRSTTTLLLHRVAGMARDGAQLSLIVRGGAEAASAHNLLQVPRATARPPPGTVTGGTRGPRHHDARATTMRARTLTTAALT